MNFSPDSEIKIKAIKSDSSCISIKLPKNTAYPFKIKPHEIFEIIGKETQVLLNKIGSLSKYIKVKLHCLDIGSFSAHLFFYIETINSSNVSSNGTFIYNLTASVIIL